jgi:uncharacterized protein (TIGR00251 family)
VADIIQSTPDGIVINVRVIPRAGRSRLDGTRGDAVLVRLNAAPVDGKANDELIALLAAALSVPPRAISILAGEHSRQKRLRISGIDAPTAQARLARIYKDERSC